MGNVRKPSKKLSFDDAVAIHRRIKAGEFQNRIAADYDVNSGRIAEIKKGVLHPGSYEVAMRGKSRPDDLFSAA